MLVGVSLSFTVGLERFKGQIRPSERVRVPPVVFVLSQRRNYSHTRMNSFGQQLPSQRRIKPEPASGNHQMPPTLPVPPYEKMHTRARAAHKRSTCSHAKQAPRSLYLPTDADDQAADECRQTGDERVHVAADNSRPSPWEESRGLRSTLRCARGGKRHRIRLRMVDIYKKR